MTRRNRSSLVSGNIDNIFDAPGRVNPKVSKKIKDSLAEYQKMKEKKPTAHHGPIENLDAPGWRSPENQAKAAETRKNQISPKQRAYIEGVTREGKSKLRAAHDAGYSTPRTAIQKLETTPAVQKAMETERRAHEEELDMTRKKVVDGLMEAVDMARVKADPLSMVAGWREVAKICGYYEPIKHKVEVSVNGQVLLHQITSMSDEDLLKMADEANVLDGEFTAIGHEEN